MFGDLSQNQIIKLLNNKYMANISKMILYPAAHRALLVISWPEKFQIFWPLAVFLTCLLSPTDTILRDEFFHNGVIVSQKEIPLQQQLFTGNFIITR